MSLSKPAKSKISESPSVIHLEEDDTEDRPAHRDQRFKINIPLVLRLVIKLGVSFLVLWER